MSKPYYQCVVWPRRFRVVGPLLMAIIAASGCATSEQTAGLIVGLTAAGAVSPAQEIEQIYYLGVFDPQEQLPPQVYRIRVHGQASFISFMRFASGWVPAQLVDSLNASAVFKSDEPGIEWNKGEDDELASLKPGRRMIMFGPEGFREVPKNHRLVIVMGSSPEAFFGSIDEALGTVAEIRREQLDSAVAQQLLTELQRVHAESLRLADFQADLARDFPLGGGGSQ